VNCRWALLLRGVEFPPDIRAGPGSGAAREGAVPEPRVGLALEDERAPTPVLLRSVEFPPDTRSRLAAAVATEFLDVAGEKNRRELDCAVLIEEAPGALFVELKLSRDGVTGSFPVIMLACLNEAPLTPCWCPGTASRPNLLPSMAEIPERTRWSLCAAFRLENWRT